MFVLKQVTSADLSNEAFPFRRVQEIDIGYARVTASRITYVGELGYELYIPVEQSAHVYDVLMRAGREQKDKIIAAATTSGDLEFVTDSSLEMLRGQEGNTIQYNSIVVQEKKIYFALGNSLTSSIPAKTPPTSTS